MASIEDGPAADEAPLVLPESLLPEQVSVEAIRREQARDPFAKDLLAKLEIEEGDCVTVAEGCAPRSGAALRLAKFASLDASLFKSLETTVIIHLQANTGPVLVPGALGDPCGASQAGVPAVTAHGVEPLLHRRSVRSPES